MICPEFLIILACKLRKAFYRIGILCSAEYPGLQSHSSNPAALGAFPRGASGDSPTRPALPASRRHHPGEGNYGSNLTPSRATRHSLYVKLLQIQDFYRALLPLAYRNVFSQLKCINPYRALGCHSGFDVSSGDLQDLHRELCELSSNTKTKGYSWKLKNNRI